MAVRKQWYDIVTPEMFGKKVIGETLSADAKSLVGRTLNVSLVEISHEYQKFYIKLRLQVDHVESNKAHTTLVGHECLRERVYRMVQRHGRRVDVVQDVVTKDGKKVRVKTVFMLIQRVGKSTKDAARKMAKDMVDEATKNMTFEDLINNIIAGDIQHDIRKECSKIYPIGSIEIRKTELEKLVAA